MSILGFLVLLVAVVMTILKLFVMKDNKPVLFAGIGTSFAGGKNKTGFEILKTNKTREICSVI